MKSRLTRCKMIAERTGYQLEGVIRNDERQKDGSLRDTLVYARVVESREEREGMGVIHCVH